MEEDSNNLSDIIKELCENEEICGEGEGDIYIGEHEDGLILNTYTINLESIYKTYMFLVKKGFKVYDIEINIDSSFYNKSITSLDIKYIGYIKNYVEKNGLNCFINIIYDYDDEASYDDFIHSISCIKWFRKLLTDYDLSPFEKLLFAYDIAKTFEYKTSGPTDDDASRDNTLHLIIKTGNIVCLGYNRIVSEIINDLDENILYDSFETFCYSKDGSDVERHSRGIVKIDDDVYDIHGIFVLDPTWDSVNDKYKLIYGKEYDALSAYEYFLVPISKYRRFFKNDTYPRFYTGELFGYEKRLTSKKLNEMVNNPIVTDKYMEELEGINYYEFERIFKNLRYNDFIKYLNCERPDIDKFLDALLKVRYCEGYSIEDIDNMLVFGLINEDKTRPIIFDSEEEKELILK